MKREEQKKKKKSRQGVHWRRSQEMWMAADVRGCLRSKHLELCVLRKQGHAATERLLRVPGKPTFQDSSSRTSASPKTTWPWPNTPATPPGKSPADIQTPDFRIQ